MLEVTKPLSVLTTCTEAKPCPWLTVGGTGTTSRVALLSARLGVSGPALIGPPAVATNRLTTEPAVKLAPIMVKLAPTMIGLLTLAIAGCPGSGVGVGTGTVGLGVVAIHSGGVGVGVAMRVAVGVGVGVAPIPVGVGCGVGVRVGVLPGVKVGIKV